MQIKDPDSGNPGALYADKFYGDLGEIQAKHPYVNKFENKDDLPIFLHLNASQF